MLNLVLKSCGKLAFCNKANDSNSCENKENALQTVLAEVSPRKITHLGELSVENYAAETIRGNLFTFP